MSETINECMQLLLNNFWILKEDDLDNYYKIKRNQHLLRDYINKTLGSRLIIHDRFIKLEKIPAQALESIGLPNFILQTDYIYLCLILLFLEDKTRETYFMLSDLIDYVKNTAVALELNNIPNWTLTKERKSLKRAVNFLEKIKVIKLKDASKDDFSDNENAEALYISTGLSNYVMRMFNNEIFDIKQEEDFIKDEWTYQNDEKGDIRKYKIYRNLIYTPCIYMNDISKSEIDYLKQLRHHISNELSNLNYELELTKNMALVFENENALTKDSFPNNKRISAIVLIVLTKLYELIKENKIILNEYEIGKISYEDLYNIIIGIKNKYNIYLSKTLKDLTDSAFFDNIIDILETYTFIRNVDNYYEILPAIRIFNSKLIENKNKQLDIWGDNND